MTDPCSIDKRSMLSLDEALTEILSAIEPISTTETISLSEALGRVLARDLTSHLNLPFDRNSAMDGYAINSRDIQPDQVFSLTLAGTSWAGKPYHASLKSGQCIRIFTGAVVPDGADTVVMQESVTKKELSVFFPARTQPYQNVRQAGEDVKSGDLLLPKGKSLTPADIGLLAAAGIGQVTVCRKPNIAFFSTGDELLPLNTPISMGKIYDSNLHMLNALLANYAVNRMDWGIVADNITTLKSRIIEWSLTHNVIISIGGASVGDADYIQQILTEVGQVKVCKIAIKPGKPLIFGQIGDCYYFGLPGNPVSMMLTFKQIVAFALHKLCGARPYQSLRLKATCTSDLKKSPGRVEFQRGILSHDDEGNCFVSSAGKQGSHLLTTMSRSNCFIILPAHSAGIKAGESVLVEPFSFETPQ